MGMGATGRPPTDVPPAAHCTPVTTHTMQVVPKKEVYTFKTQRKVPKTGLMLVGWGGNNGSTTTAGACGWSREGPGGCRVRRF